MKLAIHKNLISPTRERVAEPLVSYSHFDQINGQHPWQKLAPDAYVLYRARILRKSKVVFFNFPLAKEMGLIPQDHPEIINKQLEKKLVETFSLQIINEYDIAHKTKIPARDIKPQAYMATRYLQLQHKCKKGTTSGDGRSIWNGTFKAKGKEWDISSCGTGATCLSPGAVESGKLIKTGDKQIGYGNGLADIDEGLSAAIQSEIIHQRGITTERTLLVLKTSHHSAINVRAASSLLRPSHLFAPLRQAKHGTLKSAFDLFLDRKIKNGEFPTLPHGPLKYDAALKLLAESYGRFAAQLEREYIFCWLAWDGDNMLMDGGIIDYGSIRQFGSFHYRYRYDDVDRFSTSLTEQKKEARNLIKNLARLTDFVKNESKNKYWNYSNHNALDIFDQAFVRESDKILLNKLGFSSKQIEQICHGHNFSWFRLKRAFSFLERALLPGGLRNVPDGVNQPALYSLNRVYPELSRALLREDGKITPEQMFSWAATEIAKKKVKKPNTQFARATKLIEKYFKQLASSVSGTKTLKQNLLEMGMRASLAQEPFRLTGDGAINVVDLLIRAQKTLSSFEFHQLVFQLLQDFTGKEYSARKLKGRSKAFRTQALKIAERYRHSI